MDKAEKNSQTRQLGTAQSDVNLARWQAHLTTHFLMPY